MFVKLLFGHLIGDYFLQSDWMARNKTKNNFNGWLAAFIHCTIYSWVVAVCLVGVYSGCGPKLLKMMCFIFWTHFPIDKFSLGKYVMKFKGNDISLIGKDPIATFVYIVIDNSIHLMLMMLGIIYLFVKPL